MASDIPIADLANNLYHKLDRNKIFPPYHNKPEDLLPILNASRKCRPRRSPNSFLLCRKNVHEEAKRNGTFNMRIISKVTGMLWRDASPREKQFYEDLDTMRTQVAKLYEENWAVVIFESPRYKIQSDLMDIATFTYIAMGSELRSGYYLVLSV
ncbi:31350_t:CDS:2 [Gigaspora margarita]|uniref:31350_t:CDS:1 n=1 Tax=Gigaspora margarita TaxID=4874 RepID=A0ABN7UDP4_GIGMA|nr:31350_t:CDS:2 [Gigaspora margarita]